MKILTIDDVHAKEDKIDYRWHNNFIVSIRIKMLHEIDQARQREQIVPVNDSHPNY